jgi:hypothetical protein
MHDAATNPIIRQYLSELRRELVIQGLSSQRTEEVVRETEAHFNDMAADVHAAEDRDYRSMVLQFGSAEAMAKSISAEYARSESARKFLWPSLFVVVLMVILKTEMIWRVIPADQNLVWRGFLALAIGGFIVLGFLARKPSVGQFVALCAVLTAGGTAWSLISSYPVAIYTAAPGAPKTPSWFEPASRWNPSDFIERMNEQISTSELVGKRMVEGKTFFVSQNEGLAPPNYLSYVGEYWKPEGVRELTLGVDPERLGPSLRASSWSEAVQAWNGLEPSQAENLADDAIKGVPNDIENDRLSIAYLRWIQTQPLSVQLKLDFGRTWPSMVTACCCGLVITNLGWLAWLLYRFVQRTRRRLSYGGGPIPA